MNQSLLQKNFIFMSQLIGARVFDATSGAGIGHVSDLAAGMRDAYPRVTGLIMRRGAFGTRLFVPWKNVRKIVRGMAIGIDRTADILPLTLKTLDNETLLREFLWDKQIVDVAGSKVVRVNDLHFLREDLNLWVVHIDVGFKGLIRRLGWARPVEFLIRWLFSYDLKDHLIQWKFVQPVNADQHTGNLALKTTGAKLAELHPADVADILQELGTEERVVVLTALDRSFAADTMTELPMKLRVQTAELLSVENLALIVREMPVDEAVDLLARLPKRRVAALYSRLPAEKVAQITGLLGMADKSAGSIMNVEYLAVRDTLTAGQVIDKIRQESHAKETVYYIYVVDDNNVLVGATTLRQLLLVPLDKPVAEFMRRRAVKVRVDADIKDVAEIFYKYDFTVVPVVDRHNKLRGIVTIKDALEAVFPKIRAEAEEAT